MSDNCTSFYECEGSEKVNVNIAFIPMSQNVKSSKLLHLLHSFRFYCVKFCNPVTLYFGTVTSLRGTILKNNNI